MHFLPIPAGSVAQVCVSVTRWIIWNIPTTARERIWTTVGTPINSTAHTRLFRVHNTNCAAKRCTRRQCRRVRQALSLGRFDVSTAASGAPLHAAGLDHSTEAKWVPRRGRRRWGGPWQLGSALGKPHAGAQVLQETQPPPRLPPRVPSLEMRLIGLQPEAGAQNPRGPTCANSGPLCPQGAPAPLLASAPPPRDRRKREALGTQGARGRAGAGTARLLPRTCCVCS